MYQTEARCWLSSFDSSSVFITSPWLQDLWLGLCKGSLSLSHYVTIALQQLNEEEYCHQYKSLFIYIYKF